MLSRSSRVAVVTLLTLLAGPLVGHFVCVHIMVTLYSLSRGALSI